MSKLTELLTNKTELTHDELAEFMSELERLLKETATGSGVQIVYSSNGAVSVGLGNYSAKYEPSTVGAESVSRVRFLVVRKLIKDNGPILTYLRETLHYNVRRIDEAKDEIASRKKALAENMQKVPKYEAIIEQVSILSDIVDPRLKDIED